MEQLPGDNHPDCLRGALNYALDNARLAELEGNERLRADYMATAAEIAEVLGAIEVTPVAGEGDPVMPFAVVPVEKRRLGRWA